MKTAAILCEGAFGRPMGKTAAGLVRRSPKYRIVGVIDSTNPSGDAGEILDGVKRGIPLFPSIHALLESLSNPPDFLIVGVATIGGRLPESFRKPIAIALQEAISVISGLHEYIGVDPNFREIAERSGASIYDIRREPPLEKLRYFRNLSKDLPCKRIPVLGTDAAIGKRTTAWALTDALNEKGVKTVFVATGQTGLLQGADYGVVVDAIRGDYVVGELEAEIVRAYEAENPEVIIIEGQGSLSHPAYVTGSRAIISASSPTGIVLQHSPGRRFRSFHSDELHLAMPDLDREIDLLNAIAGCPLTGITLNHEGLSKKEMARIMDSYTHKYHVPCTDVLWFGAETIAERIVSGSLAKQKHQITH